MIIHCVVSPIFYCRGENWRLIPLIGLKIENMLLCFLFLDNFLTVFPYCQTVIATSNRDHHSFGPMFTANTV